MKILIDMLHDFRKELEQGALISLDEDTARVRVLPL